MKSLVTTLWASQFRSEYKTKIHLHYEYFLFSFQLSPSPDCSHYDTYRSPTAHFPSAEATGQVKNEQSTPSQASQKETYVTLYAFSFFHSSRTHTQKVLFLCFALHACSHHGKSKLGGTLQRCACLFYFKDEENGGQATSPRPHSLFLDHTS